MICINLLYPKGNHHDTQSVGPRSMQSFEVGFICFLEIERLICNVVLDSRVSFFGLKLLSMYCRNRPETLMSGLHQPPRIPK